MGFKNKNVLITGISGFVGSHLAKVLLDQGASVYGMVRRRADGVSPKNLAEKGILHEVRLIEGDVTDITAIGLCLRESRPEVVFHLAAQSFVPRSFQNPLETFHSNIMGSANLLEAVRLQDIDPVIIYAGSSEEYGLVFRTREEYNAAVGRRGNISPEPERFPELPINEHNPLRPISPYAVSKVQADYLMRSYHYCYGMKTIVARSFNHEGAGRGIIFVTSAITSQVMKLKLGETRKIEIGNVNVFRDWSHIADIVRGYCLLAEKGKYGGIYVQGSMRTNSVLSYLLLSLERAGWKVERIEGCGENAKAVEAPLEEDNFPMFGLAFPKTRVDKSMLKGELEFTNEDEGLRVYTDKGVVPVAFDPSRFRPVDVPLLLSDVRKAQEIGFKVTRSVVDIIDDQLSYFTSSQNRSLE